LSLTKSDANLTNGNPSISMGSLMKSKHGTGSEPHENQIESHTDLCENNPTLTHNHFEPLDMTFNGKKIDTIEEQSDIDFDADSIKSNPTLMFMSRMEDNGFAKPAKL